MENKDTNAEIEKELLKDLEKNSQQEKSTQVPSSGDNILPEFDESDEDVLLQAQMKVYDVFMSYWKHMLAGFVVILLGVLVYGLYTDAGVNSQRDIHSRIAMVQVDVPEPNPMAMYGMAPMDNPKDTARMEELRSLATQMEAIAGDSTGAGQWFAWIEAANLWKRANQPDAQIVALQKATELPVAKDLVASAYMQLAKAYVAMDKKEQAVSTLETYIALNTGFAQNQAKLNLVYVYEEIGNVEKAKSSLSSITLEGLEPSLQMQVMEVSNRLGVGAENPMTLPENGEMHE